MLSNAALSSPKNQHGIKGMIRRLSPMNARGGSGTMGALSLIAGGKCFPFPLQVPESKMRSCDSTVISKSIKNSNYRTRKCYCCRALESAGAPESNFQRSTSFWFNVTKQLDAFYRFCRPHTIIGTIVGVTSVSLLPIQSMADIPPMFLGLLKVLIPAVLMNVYVVGLNQLYDIEVDKINKPDLPLASGEFSIKTGVILVAVAFFMSFAIGLMAHSPPLLYALLLSFLLGSAYSVDLPFLRWKQNPLLAAACIVSVRAIVVQIAFFVHMQKYTLGRPIVFTRSLISATAFMCFFSVVIALFKDIPDTEGDRKFGIQSFSVHIGQKRVFWLCVSLLLVAYASAMLIGVASSSTLCRLVIVFGHALLALVLWHKALSIDLKNKTYMTSFYMLIWKLFYAEYFLIPFVR